MKLGRLNLVGSYGLGAALAYGISDDVAANYTSLIAKVDKLKTTDESLKTYVNGLKMTLAEKTTALTEVTQQLADSGVDVTKLTEVKDGLIALGDSIDAIEAADAVIATT